MICIVCGRPTSKMWLCSDCVVPYEMAWSVGERSGSLQRLIGLYKFERAKSAYKQLGDLLLSSLPDLPDDTVIVPLPTVPSHIRERGYDHMLLIAKYVASAKGLACQQLLIRQTSTKQRQAGAIKRANQAKTAFAINGQINSDTPYLLVDDVMTTGASIKYATMALKKAGAKHVWVAVIAKQPLK